MPFSFGQRVRTTVDQITRYAPAGSFGTVIHPLDEWGDIGILLDGDSSGGMHGYGEQELVLVEDVPEWVQSFLV